MKHVTFTINPSLPLPPTRTLPPTTSVPPSLPPVNETKSHPRTDANVGETGEADGGENARVVFVGTATCILEWEGVRVMTDPNFLHKGDHVHLGPGVTGTRQTNPAVDLEDLPRIDLICLSHYHADHFDDHVESSLRRSLPIITTPHAKSHLTSSDDAFTAVYDLDFFDEALVRIEASAGNDRSDDGGNGGVDDGGDGEKGRNEKKPAIKVTGMPGKHVPPGPGGVVGKMNDFLSAVPPTNGWIIELGYQPKGNSEEDFQCGYRIYISGDTLLIPELLEIPKRYPHGAIDLMLVHLGGTTIPSPSVPLLMVTMDAQQGVELVQMIGPDVTIPVHYDDYDVFLSPLSDFKKAMDEAGLSDKVVYLNRNDAYRFKVKGGS